MATIIIKEKSNCPYCGFLLSSDTRVNTPGIGTSIGNKTAKCPRCGRAYLTGQSEWNEKTKKQRVSYYLIMFIGILIFPGFYSTLVGFLCVAFLPIEDANMHYLVSISIAAVLFLFGSITMFISYLSEIKESKERLPKNGLERTYMQRSG